MIHVTPEAYPLLHYTASPKFINLIDQSDRSLLLTTRNYNLIPGTLFNYLTPFLVQMNTLPKIHLPLNLG